MIRFAEPAYLYFLLLLPVIAFLFYLFMKWKRKKQKLLADEHLLPKLISIHSAKKIFYKTGIYMLAYTILVLAMANPQTAGKEEVVQKQGIDLALAVDISRSMQARDIKPDRMERARLLANKIMDARPDDRISLTVFAGNAYLQMPLTSDHSAAKIFLNSLNTDMAGTQGTAISAALEVGRKSLQTNSVSDKIILLISDGEETTGKAEEAANEAANENIKIFSVGVGTEKGALIPLYEYGKSTGTFQKDEEGNNVVSKLSSNTLKQIAKATGGEYFELQSGTEKNIFSRLDKMQKEKRRAKIYLEYSSYFMWFLATAIFLLCVEMLPKFSITYMRNLLGRKKALVTIIALIISVGLRAQISTYYLKKGNDAYQKKEYEEARRNYKQTLDNDSKSVGGNFNMGNALFQKKMYNGAQKNYENAINNSGNNKLKAKAYYNIGNAEMKSEKNEEAIEAYKKSLHYNPEDAEAKYNLSYALRRKKEKEKQQQKKENDKSRNKPQPQQQNKQDTRQDKNKTDKLLDALKNEEQKTHQRINGNNKTGGAPNGKNW